MKKLLIGSIVVLGICLYVAIMQVRHTEKKYETAMANIKAYDSQLGSANDKCAAFQLTIDQLEYFQDSVLKELDATRKELKIKDKNLKALQQVSSSFTRIDTITMRDTLFKEPSLAIDTVLGDKWYQLRLGLKYPSMIAVKPEFKSEKHIIVSTKKETVNPPKKFFLFRWFQKKYTLLHVDVVEKNPYVQNGSSKYVEIIK